MNNNKRKILRDMVNGLRRLLEEELDGEAAWTWGMRLGLEAAMAVRGVVGPLPDYLAFSAAGAKTPSAALLARARDLLAEYSSLFTAPAALGWLHQYWHDGERASIAIAARAGQNAKVAASSLVPATQVYSEAYMVDFLVENSLGALWRETHPTSSLAAGWRAYVHTAAPHVFTKPHPAAGLTVFDPACGAGNFLLRAFELLYEMYREEGRGTPAQICAAILSTNLFGLDIDGRAVAVARASLWLRAKELAPDLTDDLPGLCRHIVAASGGKAAELGSLLTADDAGEPLAGLLRRRYSVVVTNPPYLDKRDYGRTVRDHLRTHYRAGAGNLYAAFILRCLELADDYAAMVTPQTFLFIQSYAALRQSIFRRASIRTLAQLGLGAFSDAVVDAALFVLAKGGSAETVGVYFKLTTAADKEKALATAVARANRGEGGADTYIRPLTAITDLPGQPVIYWLGDSLRAKLATAAPLKTIADVVLGMKTSDNKRFLRFWWELWPVGGDLAGWATYEKEASGYRYARAASHFVRWSEAARRFYQNYYSAQLPNPRYWFRPGLVYGLISSKAFTAKQLPAGQMTDMAASCIFPHEPADSAFLLGLLNSKVCQWLLKTFNPTVNYQPIDLQRLPVPPIAAADKAAVAHWATMAAAAAGELRAGEPTDQGYIFNSAALLPLAEKLPQRLLAIWQASLRYQLAVDAIDRQLAAAWELPAAEAAAIIEELGPSASDLPALAGYDALPDWLASEWWLRPAKTIKVTPADLKTIRQRLKRLYEGGPGRGELPEIFFARLALQTGIHPVTTYQLIAEGLALEGWHCGPLAKNLTEDFFSALIMTLLGHSWPAGKPAGTDTGPIPLTAGTAAAPLSAAVAAYIGRWAEPSVATADFAAVVGIPLDDWLARAFFPRHIRQFRKRPPVWQLTSRPGRGEAAFACLIHCRQAAGLVPAIGRLVAPLMESPEVAAFHGRLAGLADYAPAPAYGVRINIALLEAAGLLAAPVLGAAELPRALADGGRCRRGDYIL